MPPLVLIPSPLLGPSAWHSTAAWLTSADRACQVLEVDEVASRASPGSVLVPHSNAGYYAPELAAITDAAATVFVDAALAGSADRETALAPAELLHLLRGLVRPDGLLPPWTEWWPDLSDLFPSASARAMVEADQPRLPLSYFTQRIPVPARWASRPCGYLAFGMTYADELALAASLDWPTRVLDGAHLHQLHDPAAVGAAVLALERELAGPGD